MPYVWVGVVIFMSILEAVTAQFVSIWFVVGAIGALIASFFTSSVLVQSCVFVTVTLVSLVATRPIVKRMINFKKEDTNLGRYIGKKALVISEINNDLGLGQVNVSGSIWTARSVDGSKIKEGEIVIVDSINGVKLNVKSINQECLKF